MKLSIIVAVAQNHVIGCRNRIPWHVPEDLAHFRNKTMHHLLLMGRRTFLSLPHVLPGRVHWVLTESLKDEEVQAQVATGSPGQVRFFDTLENMMEEAERTYGAQEVFVVGGARFYETMLPYVDTLYVTELQLPEPPEGDAYFQWSEADFVCETGGEWQVSQGRAAIRYRFTTHRRRRNDV